MSNEKTCNRDGTACSFPRCMPCDEVRGGLYPVTKSKPWKSYAKYVQSVLHTIVVVLLTLVASYAYERLWPPQQPSLPRCAPSPWQRVTFQQGNVSQSIYLSCTEKHDEVFAWPTPEDGGTP